MAEIMYVDWDGLVYYDTRSKQYIKDIVDQTIKFGGNYSIDDVPTPGFDTLHVAYKITNEFVVTPEIDYFVDSCANKHFAEGTIILVVEDNESDTYRFDILFESCSGTSITPDSGLDLSNYYTQTEVDNLLTDKVNATELDRYYLKTETDTQLADKADKADLIGLATEEFVNKKISEAELVDKEVDLSNFYNKTEVENIVDEAVGNISVPEVPTNISSFVNDTGYITASDIPDLSEYAKLNDIPDTSSFATEDFVKQKIAEAQLSEGKVDLSAFYTKEEIDSKGFSTEEYVQQQLDEADVAGMDTRLIQVENQTTTNATKLNEIEDQSDANAAAITALDGEIDQVNETLLTMDTQITTMSQKLADLQTYGTF